MKKRSSVSERQDFTPVRFTGGSKVKTCISCAPAESSHPVSYYYASASPFHADGLVPMCKECIIKHSFNFEKGAIDYPRFLAVLRQVDKPFKKAVLDSAFAEFENVYTLDKVKEETRRANMFQVIPNYFKILASNSKYKSLRWADGEVADGAISPIPEHDFDAPYMQPVTEQMRQRFGLGFSDDDYRMLNAEYEEWCESLGGEPSDKSKREVIKNCCFAKLATVHGVIDGANISQLITSFNNSLSVGALKPQEKKQAEITPLGLVIKDIQQYAPAEFYRDKYAHKDVQQYEEYIERFMLRPMRNVLLNERAEDRELRVDAYEET